MKETSMQWLENELVNSNLKMPLITGLKVFALIKKAKEMEKQQIIEAHGNKLKKSRDEANYEYWFSGEDDYNKTFKKTEQ